MLPNRTSKKIASYITNKFTHNANYTCGQVLTGLVLMVNTYATRFRPIGPFSEKTANRYLTLGSHSTFYILI